MSSTETTAEESEKASIHGGIWRIIRRAFIILILPSIINLNAADLTIAWDPPPSNVDGSELTDLAGYELSYGASPGDYSTVLDVGNVTQTTIVSLLDGATYYFSAKAYNSDGDISDSSTELTATLNMPPVALDDSASTIFDTPVSIDVLFNDFDADGDLIQIDTVSVPMNGTALVSYDDKVEYMPDPGFSGSDSFAYTIIDGNGGSGTASVTLYVGSGGPPLLPDYIWIEAEDGQITSPMTQGVDANASGAEYIYSPEVNVGSITYEFNVSGGNYVIWALSAAGTPSPTGHNSFFLSMDGGDEDIWDLFYDVSPSPTTEWTWDPISTRSGGTYNNNLADPALFALTSGSHALTLRARESDTRLDNILITSDMTFDPSQVPPPVPEEPPLITQHPDDITVEQGDDALFSVAATGTGTLAYQWYRDTLPIVFATDSSYSYVAADYVSDNGAIFYATATDEYGTATSQTARLTVTVPNTAPVAVNDNLICEANSAIDIAPLQNDRDDDGDALIITSATAPTYGTAIVNSDWTITYTALSGFTGTDSMLYTIADSRGGTSTAIILIAIGDNAAPSVSITYPTTEDTFTTTNAVLRIEGVASDTIGVSRIMYVNNRSESGEIAGAEAWSIDGIPLYSGENVITVTAYDEADNSSADVLNVIYESAYPRLDEAVLRAGMVVQDIQIPDLLEPGEQVTAQWQVLSYVPLLSAMSITLPDGSAITNVVINAVRTGVLDGRWHVGDRHSKLYSFECAWTVPSTPGLCRIRFLCAQQDGYAYINANIPSGVDSRPYGSDGKEVLRDILPGIDTAEIMSEVLITAPDTFDTLENAVLRAGGTIESIDIADNVAQGSVIVCRWDVLSYAPIRSRIRITLPTGATDMGEATLVDEQEGRWKISSFQSRVYTFEYAWHAPLTAGDCRIRFLNAQAEGYAWMNGNIPGGVDTRPFGTDGKEIERTVIDTLFEEE